MASNTSNYEVSVLFDGYSNFNEDKTKLFANCTCTLIKGPKNIIVDTMTAWDSQKILDALEQHNLKPENIDWVICTHGHSDHIGNNHLFLNATHMLGLSVSKGDTYFLQDLQGNELGGEFEIDDKVKVIPTPGHTLSCISVIVNTDSDLGIVAIVGDLFEKEEDLNDENIWLDAGSEDSTLQRKNRIKIVEMANVIIPGHGPMFKVTDTIRKNICDCRYC